jgi:hypothetical protein
MDYTKTNVTIKREDWRWRWVGRMVCECDRTHAICANRHAATNTAFLDAEQKGNAQRQPTRTYAAITSPLEGSTGPFCEDENQNGERQHRARNNSLQKLARQQHLVYKANKLSTCPCRTNTNHTQHLTWVPPTLFPCWLSRLRSFLSQTIPSDMGLCSRCPRLRKHCSFVWESSPAKANSSVNRKPY